MDILEYFNRDWPPKNTYREVLKQEGFCTTAKLIKFSKVKLQLNAAMSTIGLVKLRLGSLIEQQIGGHTVTGQPNFEGRVVTPSL